MAKCRVYTASTGQTMGSRCIMAGRMVCASWVKSSKLVCHVAPYISGFLLIPRSTYTRRPSCPRGVYICVHVCTSAPSRVHIYIYTYRRSLYVCMYIKSSTLQPPSVGGCRVTKLLADLTNANVSALQPSSAKALALIR